MTSQKTSPMQSLSKAVTVNDNPFMKPVEWVSLALLAGVILVVLPLMLDGFRLNLVGKYLTYAFVALGPSSAGAMPASCRWARACSSGWAATAWRCT